MALANYTQLQAAVGDWLNRADLTAQIPDFIALCESKIRRLVRRGTGRTTLSLNAAEVTLPATVGELRSLRLAATPPYQWPFKIVTPETLAGLRQQYFTPGRPFAASVVNSVLLLVPAPDQAYDAELIYFSKLQPLVTVGANPELTEAPDLYLYGTLLEAAVFLEHDERVPLWQARFDAAVDELNLTREREEYGASLRPVRLPVVFG